MIRRRTLGRIALGLAVIIAAILGGGWLWLRSSLPQTGGRLRIAGLHAPVTITRDQAGIPHIRAGDDHDAAFALGFVHAQDRLFQMDMQRRFGAGRLSEVFGPLTLGSDRLMRTLGLYRLAEDDFHALSPPVQAWLQAYADGVDAEIAQHRTLPLEYYLIGAAPEPWRPADSLVWGKTMDLMLTGNERGELLRARLARELSPEQLEMLFPAYPSDAPVTIRQLASLYRALPLGRMYAALPAGVGPVFASNNWVVDGKHTKSGKPLLANDPHLGFSTPDIWYLARIDTPRLHLAGATVPGAPFIIIGHNQRIGWGFTTTGGDVEDLFVEKVDPADPGRYMTPAGTRAFAIRRERIAVKGEPPVTLTIRETRHGPVVSDLGGDAGTLATSGTVLALEATFLKPGDRTAEALYGMNRAQNWQEFNGALENFVAPEQNIVYADTGGTIGFTAPARIPIRRNGDGWMPEPGWTGEYDWVGAIPFAALPRAANPPDGHFVSANNRIVPDGYPYFISRGWDLPNRAERITQLLAAAPIQSPDASAKIQADTLSLMAKRLLPLMLAAPASGPEAAKAQAILKSWDDRMTAASPAPLIFTAWLRELNRAIFADRLGPLFEDYWDLHPRVIREILTKRQEWCKDPARPGASGCAERLRQSLDRALQGLAARYGSDPAAWRWGEAHIATFPNAILSRAPVLSDLFRVEIPADGGADTVNRGAMAIRRPVDPFRDVHGSGLRMILDFADLDASRFMIVPGESGNPLSAHYADLLHPWRDFAWLTLGPEASGATLTLEPQ